MKAHELSLAALAMLACVHCGTRTELEIAATAGTANVGNGTSGVGGSGAGGSANGGGGQGGEGGTPIVPCTLAPAETPVVVMREPGGAISPAIVVDADGHIAVQALWNNGAAHPINLVSRWRLTGPWPQLAEEQSPIPFGIESHSFAPTMLSRDRSEQQPRRFARGEKGDARITAIDPKTRKIAL